ncbi:MAG: MBL fold metallo-hydrolase [Pseudomonadota bacterium]
MIEPSYHFIRNATARLSYGGKTFLLDPMLSNKGEFTSFAGIAPNPTVELPIAVEEIVADVDAVIVSHLHDDHFDAAAADKLDKSLTLFTPYNGATDKESFKDRIESKGFTNIREIGSPVASSSTFDGITIHQVFARHGEGKAGDAMGDVFGLIFEAEGEPTIYWAGDTVLDLAGNVEAVLKRFKPDVVIAHTGGPIVKAVSPEIILMDAAQAVEFFGHAVREKSDVQIIAIHMDALDHCFSTRADLINALDDAGDDLLSRVAIPADGELVSLGRTGALTA